MSLSYPGDKFIFRRQRSRSNPYRILGLLVMIVVGLFVYREFDEGRIISPFSPTPTPTRTLDSYAMEAETHFQAGNIEAAIAAYQLAASMASLTESRFLLKSITTHLSNTHSVLLSEVK